MNRKQDIRIRLDDQRLGEILDVATEVFIAKGFSSASTNEIARLANTSKGTLYSRFPTKEALFLAVLERRMQRVFNEVAAALPLDPPMEETLREFSRRFVRIALSEDQMALLRVVSMEVPHFPQLGQRFFELGPQRGLHTLTGYMRGQIERRRLKSGDPHLMAEQYLSLLGGGSVRWAILGMESSALRRAKQHEHVEASLRTFFLAFRCES